MPAQTTTADNTPARDATVLHPEATCQRCGGPNVVWFAPNYVWNEVMPDDGGVLCPTCFILAAYQAGVGSRWRVAPDDAPPKDDMLRARSAGEWIPARAFIVTYMGPDDTPPGKPKP
jgi:hypothetical protein